jgi:hypothetical protein
MDNYNLVPVDTVLIILEGGEIIAVVIMVLPLIEKVAVVVIFWGLYLGSKVNFN